MIGRGWMAVRVVVQGARVLSRAALEAFHGGSPDVIVRRMAVPQPLPAEPLLADDELNRLRRLGIVIEREEFQTPDAEADRIFFGD